MSVQIPSESQTLVPREYRASLEAGWSLAQQSGKPCGISTLKLFDPAGRWAYYAFEAYERDDGEYILHGFCVSPVGNSSDGWKTISVAEIEAMRNRFGLPMKRDRKFSFVTRAAIERGERP